jgi:hypothetical protein
MANEELKQRIKQVFKSGRFAGEDDLVDVSDGPDGNVHVVVVSRSLDGLRMREKNDLILGELVRELPKEDWSRVTLAVGISPEQLKHAMPV